MNINTAKTSTNYVPFLVTEIVGSEATSTAVEVPWGFYIASQNRRILTRAVTTSLGSCIAYLFWDPENSNFLFAHVSTNGEACSVVNLVRELTGERYSGSAYFVCATGKTPTDSTTARINHIVSNIGQPHRYFHSRNGGVTVDIGQETIVQSGGPVAPIAILSGDTKRAALTKREDLPLEGIQVTTSWIGSTSGSCPELARTRGRAGSVGS